jgi:hypothetical protein
MYIYDLLNQNLQNLLIFKFIDDLKVSLEKSEIHTLGYLKKKKLKTMK